MSRFARVVVPGIPFHVTQRGNNRQDVFLADSDRQEYLGLLAKRLEKTGAEILAYCLMGNHVHLIMLPHAANDLAETLGRVHCFYAQRFNTRNERSGHLWQNRFFSCALDDDHLQAAIRYVELNPVRAGIISCPWEYPWSSAGYHALGIKPQVPLAGVEAFGIPGRREWKGFLIGGVSEDELESIRTSTRKGLPLGEQKFVERLEGLVSRELSRRAVGHPCGH